MELHAMKWVKRIGLVVGAAWLVVATAVASVFRKANDWLQAKQAAELRSGAEQAKPVVHVPVVAGPAAKPIPDVSSGQAALEPWARIRSGTVRYRGRASGHVAVTLQFRNFNVLANGHQAAVFVAKTGGRHLEAWIAPDHRTGVPRVVHALGGINKAADVCFVAA